MKVITLKQPWASLVANGYKKYEFRSWKIKNRGKVLIHAGKGIDKSAMERFKNYNLDYPSERIIAIVNIDDCIKFDEKTNKAICLIDTNVYGDKERLGYAWKLSNIKIINIPYDIPGKQGFWEYDYKEKD